MDLDLRSLKREEYGSARHLRALRRAGRLEELDVVRGPQPLQGPMVHVRGWATTLGSIGIWRVPVGEAPESAKLIKEVHWNEDSFCGGVPLENEIDPNCSLVPVDADPNLGLSDYDGEWDEIWDDPRDDSWDDPWDDPQRHQPQLPQPRPEPKPDVTGLLGP